MAWQFISGQETETPMVELGWNSVGILELTALPSIEKERWVAWVREADVLLVNGGDPLYLAYWMRQSGLADLLPSLRELVWVGLSAGSMVMAPRIGKEVGKGSAQHKLYRLLFCHRKLNLGREVSSFGRTVVQLSGRTNQAITMGF